MTLILRRLSKASCSLRSPPSRTYQLRAASFDAAAVQYVRDRGLDHAVERERNLCPLINLKNLLKSEPSKSLPISVISQQRESLEIPVRPIEFVRRYPSVFEEFTPGAVSVHPHVKLKDEVLELDAEEQLIYQSDSFRNDAADRVLKLLMLSRANRFPLAVLDRLMWDMGLPWDFVQTVVPEFPDYFRVVGNGDVGLDSHRSGKSGALELVCWSNEHAVSVIKKKGTPVVFPMNFSKGFEVDKKFQKWIDDWQRLPYVSPYEDTSHLGPQTDESDKWAVAVLHELLNLFASKKTDKENVLCVGEYLGIKSRFKRALLNHPGIFYLSNKLGTYTVVLKEAFKRGSLVEEHPMMVMRSRYIHLMNTVKEEKKALSAPSSSNKKQDQKKALGPKEQVVEVEDQSGEGKGAHSLSSSEFDDSDDVGEDEDVRQNSTRRNVTAQRGRVNQERDNRTRGRSTDLDGKRMRRRQFSEEDGDARQTHARRNLSMRRGRENQENDSNTRSRSRSAYPVRKSVDRRRFNGEDGDARQTDALKNLSMRRGRENHENDSNARSRSHSAYSIEKRMDRRQFNGEDKDFRQSDARRNVSARRGRSNQEGDSDRRDSNIRPTRTRMGRKQFGESEKNASTTFSDRREPRKGDKPRTGRSDRSTNVSIRSTSRDRCEALQ